MMMNHASSSSPTHSYMPGGMVGPRNSHLFNGGSMPLVNGVNGQLQNMQISSLAAAQQAMAAGALLGDHNHVSSMLDPAMMMSMNMSTDDGMPLDPQLCGGDQFSPMTSSAPPTSMMNEYGNLGGGSTLTEFTKRRNWSQRILEELQDFLHILSPTGKIVYASPSAKSLTGFEPEELMGKFITEFIHPDDSGLFVREFNESIATGQALRLFYRFQKTDMTYAIFETNGHPHIGEAPQFSPSAIQSVCKGFFMMSRPYPTRNAALLDSFLEHKIENERLMKRIEELRKEEYEEHQQQQRQRQQYPNGTRTDSGTAGSSMTGNDTPMTTAQTPNGSDAMPPPAKPTQQQTSAALTRQNLDRMEQSNLAKADSIRDKMARFGAGGVSHMDSIEMLTGLRYREGERSKGISTGDTSPALIRGDAGVPIPIDKESRHTSEKKKKQKIADEYVCTDCGTLDSPEWRKGPKGPKTLCNACGLRWAKKEKKRNQSSSVVSIPQAGSNGGSLAG